MDLKALGGVTEGDEEEGETTAAAAAAAAAAPAAAKPTGVAGADDDDDEEGGELAAETFEEFDEEDEDGEGDDDDGADEEEGASEPAVPKGPDNSTAVYHEHADSVYCIAGSPTEPHIVASGDGSDVVKLWDARTGATLATLTGHTDTVVAVAFNAGGTLLATGSMDSTVRVWAVPSGAEVATCDGPGDEVTWVCWHAKGDVLLAGSADATAWMWSVRVGKPVECMAVFAGHEAAVTAGSFTGNGKALVTASADGTARAWNPRTSACTTTLEGRGWHEDVVNALAVAPDKPLLLTGSQDGTARLSNFVTGKVLGVLHHGRHAAVPGAPAAGGGGGGGGAAGGAGSAPVDRPGDDDAADAHGSVETYVGVAHARAYITVDNTHSRPLPLPISRRVAFCSSHPYAASGATDGSLVVWDLDTATQRHRLLHDDAVVKVAWVPGTALVGAATADGGLYLWDARNGKLLGLYTGHAGIIMDFVFAAWRPAGSEEVRWHAVTAGDDHVCRVYTLPAGIATPPPSA